MVYRGGMSALQRIIDHLDTQAATGAVVGVNQQTVAAWLSKGVPPKHVIPLCAAVFYRVTPHQLRPDVYPHPDDGLPEALRNQAAA